jgi:4-hydroxy-2-oxoheptanedioate aldolase
MGADRMAHLIRTASLNNLDSIMRVNKTGYSGYIHPLELGGTGLMVPHCMSGDEARSIVSMTRFHPLGRRALDSGNSDGHYCMIPLADYLRQSNENQVLILQIEDPEAVEQVDEIAAVPGVDVLFVGPGDLSHALGVPGQMNAPEVQRAYCRVAEACQRNGIHWGTPVSAATAEKFLEMGARFLNAGADVLGLQDYYKGIRTQFEKFGFTFEPKI